jgi:hypothetical protein
MKVLALIIQYCIVTSVKVDRNKMELEHTREDDHIFKCEKCKTPVITVHIETESSFTIHQVTAYILCEKCYKEGEFIRK